MPQQTVLAQLSLIEEPSTMNGPRIFLPYDRISPTPLVTVHNAIV